MTGTVLKLRTVVIHATNVKKYVNVNQHENVTSVCISNNNNPHNRFEEKNTSKTNLLLQYFQYCPYFPLAHCYRCRLDLLADLATPRQEHLLFHTVNQGRFYRNSRTGPMEGHVSRRGHSLTPLITDNLEPAILVMQ